jgi:geranyl-CoA carboxylase alpha subunit
VRRLLIANRGEIALRIARTARRMGIEIVAVYSDADADAPHVRGADLAYRIGGPAPSDSYLNADAVLGAALAARADAVHPGYGFLAENADFAERCTMAGLTFVGPSSDALRSFGNKAGAKRLLAGGGVPFLPGYYGTDQTDDTLAAAARELGMPIMIKAAAGGGGRGMRLVRDDGAFAEALRAARSEALSAFGDDTVLLERALLAPRHVEVQIFGDRFGSIVHLGERDCSVQRRHQKLIEESPSPAVDEALRERLGTAAVAVARAAAYVGAGTVEFLLDGDGNFYFIEVNARLQVEHAVTESVTSLDLVEWQLRIARGEPLPRAQQQIFRYGHAIEARLCAEDPARDFLPQAGQLVAWEAPHGVRVEDALESGAEISPYYDSMIAKLIAHGGTREEAREKLCAALRSCVALGVPTNAAALIACLEDATFVAGAATTRFIDERLALADFRSPPAAELVGLAAALSFSRAAQTGGFGPWTAWSSSQLPAATIVLAAEDGERHSVRLNAASALRIAVSTAGTDVEITFAPFGAVERLRPRGHLRFARGNGPWERVAFAVEGTTIYLAHDGRSYAFKDVTAEPPDDRAASGGDGFLRAPMSGRVVAIYARAGERAGGGSTLVALEAMKMQHVLAIPVDVVVRTVNTVAGAQVHANDILLEYDLAAPVS